MLSDILDRALFERRFQKVVRLSDFPTMLEGNRVAEMFGVSPSYGKQYDVLKLRQLYRERLPQALYYGRRSTQPSNIVALKFICELIDEFISIEQNEGLREFFADTVERAALFANANPPTNWQLVIDTVREKRRQQRQQLEGRLPTQIAARQAAQREFSHNFSLLEQEGLPNEAVQV